MTYKYVPQPGDSLQTVLAGIRREDAERRARVAKSRQKKATVARVVWGTLALTAGAIARGLIPH